MNNGVMYKAARVIVVIYQVIDCLAAGSEGHSGKGANSDFY